MKRSSVIAFICAACCGPGFLVARTGQVVFPDDTSVLNARLHLGAKGDGISDDTNALQAGLDASSSRAGRTAILYLPEGTYRVTRTLVAGHGVGPWVYGASRDRVVIRLDDGVGTNVTAVLRTHPNDGRATSADHFMRNFRNLTIDAGDNPGVDGIRWFGNNSSILQNIRVVGNGRIGINSGFVGQNGPNLIQDAGVEGFETGIRCAWSWGQTLSRVHIANARSNAVHVTATCVAIEDLVTENCRTVLLNDYPNDWTWWGGVVALVGGHFSTSAGAGPAIRNTSVLYARDLRQTGYSALTDGEAPGLAKEGGSGEYLSHTAVRAFENSKAAGLRLPVKREPVVPWETDPAKWVCANEHGAVFGDNRDDTDALQRAVDAAAAAGATTVYLRGIGGGDPNWYTLEGEVRLRKPVRHVIGLGFGRIVAGPEGRFVVDDGSAPVVKFQHIQAFGGRGVIFENRSATNTLFLESCDGHVLGTGGGDIFMTDCPASVEMRSPGQSLWARQLNPEGTTDTGLVRNHGGRLWVMGVKHEGAGVRLVNDNGGEMEVFGMFNYSPGLEADDPRAAIETDESPFCLMAAKEVHFGGSSYPVKVRETRGGVTREVGEGMAWAMYTGWAPGMLGQPAPAARPRLSPAGGDFIHTLEISATSTTPGAVLRHTVDGTEPGPDSPVLVSPLKWASTGLLKVRAFAKDRPPSALSEASFTRVQPRAPDGVEETRTDFDYAYFESDMLDGSLPDFASLTPVATGRVAVVGGVTPRRENHYAVRYNGFFAAPAEGIYTFHTISDDGSRLWVGGKLVVDNDGAHAPRRREGRIALQPGNHALRIEHCQGAGEADLKVEVEGPEQSRRALDLWRPR